MKRKLGRSGIEVNAMGMGCWAIGGPFSRQRHPVGWGKVNDDESIRALKRSFELGINFYDTADIYGCGHSEKLIAQALGDKRDKIIIATKAGHVFIEETREAMGVNGNPDYIRKCCDQSLRRLCTDYIDLYQFHLGNYDPDKADEVLAVFDDLVEKGKVRFIGWSTDNPEAAKLFANSKNCAAIQQRFNVFIGNTETLAVCEKHNLASINRGPLAMGMLTGKFTRDTKLPENDIRHNWDLKDGFRAKQLQKLENIRDVLTSDGRTPAQGALAWLWARSEAMIPIPGFKTVDQVEENIGALEFGPLTTEQMQQIDQILERKDSD
jgi:aryl-alcohol dehydrogenase-like predicted oxidoreductase